MSMKRQRCCDTQHMTYDTWPLTPDTWYKCFVLVLLCAHVVRFIVSLMQDYLNPILTTPCPLALFHLQVKLKRKMVLWLEVTLAYPFVFQLKFIAIWFLFTHGDCPTTVSTHCHFCNFLVCLQFAHRICKTIFSHILGFQKELPFLSYF